MGPSALRIAGLGAAIRRLGHRVDLEEDIPVPAMETRSEADSAARYKPQILEVCRILAERVEIVLGEGKFPLVLGGDHSIAMGSFSGAASWYRQRGEHLGLIWFDAHGDMNLPGISPTGNIHGMPLSHLLGRGDEELRSIKGFSPKVRPGNVALIGVRDIDADERRVIRESGIHAFTMREIDEHGMAKVIRQALEIVKDGTAGYHVSFDVDGCDPSVIPGSGTLVPGGVEYREAHLMLEYIADDGGMTSMDVVELNPLLDNGNISAERTLHLILSALGKSIL
jgi:arginase